MLPTGHSMRKGAATHAAHGMPFCAPFASICLRAGWSMGVRDRYIKYSDGGDRLTGRLLCGLPVSDENFACLPPHFTECPPGTISQAVALQFPTWRNVVGLTTILPYALASLIKHKQWLLENLPQKHPLFMSRLMQDGSVFRDLEIFLNKSHLKSAEMCAMAIPPVTSMHIKMAVQQEEIQKTQNLIIDIPVHMRNSLQELAADFGHVTPQSIELIMKGVLDERFKSVGEPVSEQTTGITVLQSFPVHINSGVASSLPLNFTIPSMQLRQGHIAWWSGMTQAGILPLRFVRPKDFHFSGTPDDIKRRSSTQQKRFSDWTKLFNCMQQESMKHHPEAFFSNMKNRAATAEEEAALFQSGKKAVEKFHTRIGGRNTKRVGQWSVVTMVKRLRQHETNH